MPAASPWLALVLAALAAIGPFSISTYLPAFPVIGAELGASHLRVQQSLTAYMVSFAVMALWHGALSDRFGRRREILAAMGVYVLASLLCAAAPRVEWLWAGRVLQGMSAGAGMVVGRAVIRDLHEGPQAQRLMSRVMMVFSLAPAIAPLVGGALVTVAGWRSIFVFLAGVGVLLALLTWRFLPETLPPAARHPLHPVALAGAYRRVLSHAGFVLLALAIALNFNGFFVYVLSAPAFLIGHLGLNPRQFGWLFVPAVTGMVLGSMASARLAGRWRPQRTIAVGYAVMVAAGAGNVVHAALYPPGVPGSVLPVGFYTFGMSLAMPSLTLLALELFAQRRGLAASCQSFLQVGLNSLTAGVIAPLLWRTPTSLAAGMCLFCGLGLTFFLAWGARAREAACTPPPLRGNPPGG